MEITFQIASTDEIPLIQRLSQRIWREHYPGIISPAQIEYMLAKMYATDVILNEIEEQGYRYVIVSSGEEPVGYLAFRHDDKAATILLGKIYLLPSCHGKGVGRRMLEYVKQEAIRIGARTVFLFVNKNNSKAIRAYERFGFSKAETLVTDIGGGFVMDDYRMELRV